MRAIGNLSDQLAIAADKKNNDERYWMNTLSGQLVKSSFTCDFNKADVYTARMEFIKFDVKGKMFSRLMQLSNYSDVRMYITLLSVLVLLLNKHTGNKDIIIGVPIYKQNLDVMFINTVLTLRNVLDDNWTFKELLLRVGQVLFEAAKNQNYPIETLLYKLNIPFSRDSEFPLFDTAILLENIHEKEYIQYLNLNLRFIFRRTPENLGGTLEYHSSLYCWDSMERIVNQYTHLLEEAIFNINKPISALAILSEGERQQVLFDFNNTNAEYPVEETLHGLFVQQVERTPDHTALVCMKQGAGATSVTYKELNEKTNQLALGLRKQGVNPGTVIGIMVERSLEMMVGIFGILKAGGVYLPINPGYPQARVIYILEDSGTQLLLTQDKHKGKAPNSITHKGGVTIIHLEKANLYEGEKKNTGKIITSRDLAYVIYTSGSTGKPKGVMIEHRSVVNRLNWMQSYYPLGERDVILQKTDFTFDVSVWELFWWSFHGASVCLLRPNDEVSPGAIIDAIESSGVTTIHFVPSMLDLFLDYLEEFGDVQRLSGLRRVFSSGEALALNHAEQFHKMLGEPLGVELINLYGPTEATVDVSYFDCSAAQIEHGNFKTIPIGKPIDNIKLYVVNSHLQANSVGVQGELCISGDGLARGYLNRPELTMEKFIKNPYEIGKLLYKTGDLARWLNDGNIEFMGRIDHQVKIRGFRVELGEIESQLVNHEAIKEAVVVAREDENKEKYLCAYIVPDRKLSSRELREYLARSLPNHMIPSYFVSLETIPLTSNGKTDRKKLPAPKLKDSEEYKTPQSLLEKKLVEIWVDILGIGKEKIGMEDNFFDLGGHSLKATILVSKIHKVFKVIVPLAELFKTPSIRGLSGYIEGSATENFAPIEPVEIKEYYSLSSGQKRIYMVHHMQPQGTGYNIPKVLQLIGKVDRVRLQSTFNKLIETHESLRTSFSIIEGEPIQRIHNDIHFEIEYFDLKISSVEIIKNFLRPFDLSRAPLLRAGLIREEDEKHILMVDMHHIICDGVSHDILIDSFLTLYEGRKMPQLRIQYKDFAGWQKKQSHCDRLKEQEEYWLKRFKGDIPVLEFPIDYPRPPMQHFEGHAVSGEIDEILTAGLKEIASEQGATLYMVLLSSFALLLSRYTNQNDIIVGSPVAGRGHSDLERIVGMFVNVLLMRNTIEAKKSFAEFLEDVKYNTLRAFENQDYSIDRLAEQLDLKRGASRNLLYEVIFAQLNIGIREFTIPGLRLKPFEYSGETIKTDLRLGVEEKNNKIEMVLTYSTALFKRETAVDIMRHYKEILEQAVMNKQVKLEDIKISHDLVTLTCDVFQEDESEFNF
jgi:amino acid adenylation domain-containing protein